MLFFLLRVILVLAIAIGGGAYSAMYVIDHDFGLGAIRFGVVANLGLIMAAVPIKMVLRWMFNLKYIVNLPDIQLNI